MKKEKLLGFILCICIGICLLPSVEANAANGDFIGGVTGTDPLKIVYNSAYSTVLLQAPNNIGTYANQYYNGSSTAVALGFTYNGAYYQYNTKYYSTSAKSGIATSIDSSTAGFSQSKSGNTLSLKWSGLAIGSTGGTFDFELTYSYTSGASSFQRGYKVTTANGNAYPLENVQLAYGGDAYFGGGDTGYDYAVWNDYVHMVYLQQTNTAGSSSMYLSSPSATRYYAGSYSIGKTWASKFTANSHTNSGALSESGSAIDNGYYLQWDIGTVAAGSNYYVSATEGIDKSTVATRIYAPDSGNAIENIPDVSQIVPSTDFLLVNMDSANATATGLAVSLSSSIGDTGVTAQYLGSSSYELAGNANQVLPVQVVVPPDTPAQDITVTLSGLDSVGSAINASFTFSVKSGDTSALPQISNEQATNGTLSFVLNNADSYRVTMPDGTSVINSGDWDSVNTTPVSLPISEPGEHSIYVYKTTDGVTAGVFKSITVAAINPTVNITRDGTAVAIENVSAGTTGLALSDNGTTFHDMDYTGSGLYSITTGLLDSSYGIYGKSGDTYTRLGDYTLSGDNPSAQLSYITVAFDCTGGFCDTLSKVVRIDDVYGTLPTPELSGRSFRGWHFLDSTPVDESSIVTLTNAHTLYAMWDTASYAITNETAENCYISEPSGDVEAGSDYSFTVTLNTGYSADDLDVSANGVRLSPLSVNGNTLYYTIYRISCPQAINATGAKPIFFPVTLPQGEGYSAYDDGNVNYGENYSFTVSVYPDYAESVPIVTDGGNLLTPTSEDNGVYTYELSAVTSVPAISISGVTETIQYTATFTSFNGVYAVQSIENCGIAVEPTPPQRIGYSFGGWQLDGELYDFTIPVTGDITLNALWNPDEAVITYYNDIGTAIPAVNSYYGETITLPVAEGSVGKSFVGWAFGTENFAAGIVSWAGGAPYCVTGNAELYAVWTDLVLPVALPVGRGYIVSGADSVVYGTDYSFTLTLLDGYTQSTPVVSDYGTPLVSSGSNPYTYIIPAVTTTPSITVENVETVPLWTVTYMSDGRVYTRQVVENGSICPIPMDPYKQGAVFSGWKNGAEDYDFSNSVSSDLSLTAQWIPLSYSITVPGAIENGAYAAISGLNADGKVDYGTNFSFSITPDLGFSGDHMVVAVNGVILYGMNNGDSYTYTISNVVSDQTIAVYGIDQVFSISLPVGKGFSMSGDGSVAYGSDYGFVLVLLDSYDQSDFEVLNNGKPMLPEGENPYTFDLFNVSSQPNITITGVTQNPTWDVSYISQGKAYTTQKVFSGGTAVSPIEPTREGYIFGGWYLGADEYDFSTPVTGNITLNAKWTVQSFTVTEPIVANGTFSYVSGLNAEDRVDYGSTYSFTITPDHGYSIEDIQVSANGIVLDGSGLNGTFTYRITPVTSDVVILVRNIHDIIPEITLNRLSDIGIRSFEYKINDDENYIAYAGRFNVNYGDRLEIRAILNEGYCIKQWSDGVYGNPLVIDSVETSLSYTPTTTGSVITVDVSDMDYNNLGGALWIDGLKYPDSIDGNGIGTAEVKGKIAKFVTVYTYREPDNGDSRGIYPTGMRVWELDYDMQTHAYTATLIPEFENLLAYCGSSIRIKGITGIRMITGITTANRNSLIGEGLAGYTLEEYGTLVSWADSNDDPVLTDKGIMTNYAYNKATGEDPVFSTANGITQFTNVMVRFNDAQCIPEMAMRPYIKLLDGQGNEVTLYGGVVQRSIGFIAYQNHSTFEPSSNAYKFVWGIIHSVFGEEYDALYRH